MLSVWWQHGREQHTLLCYGFVYCNLHVAILALFMAGFMSHMYVSSPCISFILYISEM